MEEMHLETRLASAGNRDKKEEAVALAAEILRQGGLVALPTETVYGIAANALDPKAVARIFQAKGRPQDNPLIVHISGTEELQPLVGEIPHSARALMDAFWPGPLTMILPKSGLVPEIVSAGLDTVAVRMPSLPLAREIIRAAGVPLAAPSANLSGKPSPTTARHCVDDLWGRVELIVDGGSCPVGLESTVISLAGGTPRLLRPGAVTLEELEQVLGPVEVDPAVLDEMDENSPASSPGMKYKHYAPRARVEVLHGAPRQIAEYIAAQKREGAYALVFQEDAPLMPVPTLSLGPRNDPASHGARLFALLRELDEMDAQVVYAQAPSRDGVGLAVYNRLIRAAGFCQRHLDDTMD